MLVRSASQITRTGTLRHLSRMEKHRLKSMNKLGEAPRTRQPTPAAALRTMSLLEQENHRLRSELMVSENGVALMRLKAQNSHLLESLVLMKQENQQLKRLLSGICQEREEEGIWGRFVELKGRLQQVQSRNRRLYKESKENKKLKEHLAAAVTRVKEEAAHLQHKDKAKENVSLTVTELRQEVDSLKGVNRHLRELNQDFEREILQRAQRIQQLEAKIIEQNLVLEVFKKKLDKPVQDSIEQQQDQQERQLVSKAEAQLVAAKLSFNLIAKEISYSQCISLLQQKTTEMASLFKGGLISFLCSDPFLLDKDDASTLMNYLLGEVKLEMQDQALEQMLRAFIDILPKYQLLCKEEEEVLFERMRMAIQIWLRCPELPLRVTAGLLRNKGQCFGYEAEPGLLFFILRKNYELTGQLTHLQLVDLQNLVLR